VSICTVSMSQNFCEQKEINTDPWATEDELKSELDARSDGDTVHLISVQ
jgi:hypothetical protein